MQFLLDILSARLNLVLVILLCSIYILRTLIQRNYVRPGGFVTALNRVLRRHHKSLGLLAIGVGLFHGVLSSEDVISFNFGTGSWALMVLLGATWYYKAKLKQKGWLYYHRVLTVVFIATLIIHIIDVGGFTADLSPDVPERSGPESDQSGSISPGVKYKDGVYTGKGTGYRPGLVVQVTIAQGAISAITIVSHNERDPKHYSRALQQVPAAIITAQSTAVDGVSGATRTSNGIKSAVRDALAQAVEK